MQIFLQSRGTDWPALFCASKPACSCIYSCLLYTSRLDDISTAGIDLIQDIVQIFDNYGLETEIIAASIRNPIHVTDLSLIHI